MHIIPSGLIVTDDGMESSWGISVALPKAFWVKLLTSLIPQTTSKEQSYEVIHIQCVQGECRLLNSTLDIQTEIFIN